MRRKQWYVLLGALSLFMAIYIWLPSPSNISGEPLAPPNPHAGHGEAPAVIPLAADMTDPYLDPVALKMSHDHTAVAEQTEDERALQVTWSWPEQPPEAGKTSLLRLKITDGNGRPVPEFMVVNEKLLHLIAVRDDLEHFQHLHPVHLGGGVFEMSIPFVKAGNYKLFADFMPAGMAELTRSTVAAVKGEAGKPLKLAASKSYVQEVGQLEVTLHLGHLMAGMPSEMTYSFRDKKSGKPILDMEPYLGSIGHVVAMNETAEHYIHVHPLNWAASGPIATFAVTFPEAGLYKIWGQFQWEGKLLVVPFVMDVPV